MGKRGITPCMYALYEDDELLCIGTVKQIAQSLGLKENSIRFFGTPKYINVISKKARKVKTLVKLEDDEIEK